MILEPVEDFIQDVIAGRNEIVIQDYIDETFKEGGLDRLEQLYTELFIESKVSNVTNACLTQALSLIENNIQKHLRDNPFILNTDPHIDELLKNLTDSIICQKIYKLCYITEINKDYELSRSHVINLPFKYKWQISYKYPEQVYVSVDNADDPDCRKKNTLCFGYLYNYPMADSADLRVIAELTYNYNLTLVHKLKEYILFFFNDYWEKRDSSEGLAIWEKEMSTEELIEFRKSDKYKDLINYLIDIIMHPKENRVIEVKIPKYKYDDFITRQTQVDLKIDELRKFVNECCINYCLADLLNQIFLKFKKAFNYDLEEEYYVFRNFKYVHSLFGLALEIDNFFNDNHNIAKVLPEHNLILFPDIKLIFSSIKEFCIDKDDYTRAIEKRNEVFNMFSKYIQQISLFEKKTLEHITTYPAYIPNSTPISQKPQDTSVKNPALNFFFSNLKYKTFIDTAIKYNIIDNNFKPSTNFLSQTIFVLFLDYMFDHPANWPKYSAKYTKDLFNIRNPEKLKSQNSDDELIEKLKQYKDINHIQKAQIYLNVVKEAELEYKNASENNKD